MANELLVQVRRVCRKTAFGLLPTLLLFFTAELVQRVRYSIVQHNPTWMYYGLRWSDPAPGVPVIPVTGTRSTNRPFRKAPAGGGEDAREELLEDYFGSFDPNAVNILCIGGSSTYGVFNEPRYTYPYLLSGLLNKGASANAKQFSVLNRGLPGQSAEDYKATLDLELAEYSPDAVIFYTGYNDMFIKDVNRTYSTFSSRLYAGWYVLERYSLLALTTKEKYLIWNSNQRKSYDEERARLGRLEGEFRNALEVTVVALVGRGIRVILIPEVLMAKNFGWVTQNYESYAPRYVNIPGIVQNVAKRHGAEFIDLQKDFDATDFEAMFKDPVHLTDEGNRILSRLILERSTTLRELRSHK